jgi:hypothetical protein
MTHARSLEFDLDRLGAESFTRRVSPEKSAALPSPADPYQAAGFPEDGVGRLVIMRGKQAFSAGATAYLFLQYLYVGRAELGYTATGQIFRFLYTDFQPLIVTVYGRALLRTCDQISHHRMPWIREADRDFTGDGLADDDPVITRIEIADWKPEPRQEEE